MITGSIAGGAGSFDSGLDDTMVRGDTNAELTLYLRIFLEQVPGGGTIGDHDGTQFSVRAWTQAAWDVWKRRYQQQAQAFWHGKFWLRTPDTFTELDATINGVRYRPNIYCRFRLSVVDTAATAHKTIRVARLVPTAGMNSGTFRSNDSLYDDFDLGVGRYVRGGRVYYQRTFIHEVGHALGIPHIAVMTNNPSCTAGSTNADACYGVTHAERRDIMGFGMNLSLNDALPWKKRIAEHTHTSETLWTAAQVRVYPRRLAA